MNLLTLALLPLLSLTAAQSNPKRGLVHVTNTAHAQQDLPLFTRFPVLSWYYNYGYNPSKNIDKMEFVPQLWGGDSSKNGAFCNSVKGLVGSTPPVTHVMGFNEPDESNQYGGSDILPAKAAEVWRKEMEPCYKLGVKIGAPAMTGSSRGIKWLEDFVAACPDCKFDFIPVHFYGSFEGMASHLGMVRERWLDKPIWVTEFGLQKSPLADTQSAFNQSVAYMDRLE